MIKHFILTSLRVPLMVAALVASGVVTTAQSAADSGAVEFHVKPGRCQPFTSTDMSIRPQLGKPGKPKWATGGIQPGFWFWGGGSAERPFATLYQLKRAVRELLRTKGMPEHGIRVVVHGGLYRLTQTLQFIPEDSGKPGNPVVYTAAPGEKPVFSEGSPVAGWTKPATAAPGLPRPLLDTCGWHRLRRTAAHRSTSGSCT